MLNKGELEAETTVADPKTIVALSNTKAKLPNMGCVGFNMSVGRVMVVGGGVQKGVFVVEKDVILVRMLCFVIVLYVFFVKLFF